jgi:8-oxo-dGTP diphosphatase
MLKDAEIPTRVGIGLIGRAGRYLIRQRRPGQIMSGVWEFPGGKCEPGETPEHATARECLEEVGVAVKVERLRATIVHHYEHGLVELSFYDCRTVDPLAEPAEGSGFLWVAAGVLAGYTFPGANEPIVAALARGMGDVGPIG